jgi:hypothetical protein
MFLKNIKVILEQLRARQTETESRIEVLEEKPQVDIQAFKNEVEARLLLFHKEITDRYFDTLERILKVHTETSLITALANQISPKTMADLKSSLLQPFLETKWKSEREEKGQKIVNAGEQIISEYDTLHTQMLQDEKQGKDISKTKLQLDVYKNLIERLTK